MRDELHDHSGGWIAATKYVFNGYSARPLPVNEAAGCTADFVTVPGEAFDPPCLAPVRLPRQGREVYALKETAYDASVTLAAAYNDQAAKQKGRG